MEKRHTLPNRDMIFCFALFFLCLIPEAVFITRLGFYWDDWSQMFLHVKFGDAMFWEYFSHDRPGSAWTPILFFPICGTSPVKWHLLFICLKSILTVLFWKIFRHLFPSKPGLPETAAVLFAVCPLFSQEYISIAYSQHYTDFIFYVLSVYTLLLAAENASTKRQIGWYVISILSMLVHLTISEYFVFLELMKLPFLWIIFRNAQNPHPFKKALKWFLIHFGIFIAYCLFRLNLSRFFPIYGADQPDWLYLFLDNPISGINALLHNMAVDLTYPFTGFLSRVFDFDLLHILTIRELSMIAVSFVTAAFSVWILSKIHFGRENEMDGKFTNFIVIMIGIIGMIFAIFPFWIMNENCLITSDPAHADRCFLAAAPFFCLLLSWLLSVFFPNPDSNRGILAAAVLVFLFTHSQLQINQTAADNTRSQNLFYQQLAERVPAIEDGTAIVDNTIIFPSQGNFSTASALNILYPNNIRENGDVPIWIFSYDQRLYEDHGGFTVQNRNYHFNQPKTDYIYIDHDNKFANCVWVFGPDDIDNPHITEQQKGWIAASNLNKINADAELIPNSQIFGKPYRNWCVYYEQAALLRQREDWEQLSQLARTVLAEGFSPSDSRSNAPFEWWPFIEGLYRTGEVNLAMELAEEAVRVDNAYENFFKVRLENLK